MTAGRPLVIIDAPSNLGLMPPAPGVEPGTRHGPDALRDLGLHGALKPVRELRVEPAVYTPDEDRQVNIRNMAAIADHAQHLADAIETCLRNDEFVLVLGGDCSLLVGAMLANARFPGAGLVFIDGHSDFFLPEQSGTGGAAGMDLALATGWGPRELTDLEGRRPYVTPAKVAVLGNRDQLRRAPAPIPEIGDAGFHYQPLDALRRSGMIAAGRAARSTISPGGEPYWIHLDVDVLDSDLMPAVDSPQTDGLAWAELEELLVSVLAGNARGLQVTIYDPTRDPGGRAGQELVRLLIRALGA